MLFALAAVYSEKSFALDVFFVDKVANLARQVEKLEEPWLQEARVALESVVRSRKFVNESLDVWSCLPLVIAGEM